MPVEDDDNEETLNERIKAAERRLLVEHPGWPLGRWRVDDRKVTIP